MGYDEDPLLRQRCDGAERANVAVDRLELALPTTRIRRSESMRS